MIVVVVVIVKAPCHQRRRWLSCQSSLSSQTLICVGRLRYLYIGLKLSIILTQSQTLAPVVEQWPTWTSLVSAHEMNMEFSTVIYLPHMSDLVLPIWTRSVIWRDLLLWKSPRLFHVWTPNWSSSVIFLLLAPPRFPFPPSTHHQIFQTMPLFSWCDPNIEESKLPLTDSFHHCPL